MSAELLAAASALRAAAGVFEPRLLSGDDARRVCEELARAEKACAGARARAAARAAECGAHRNAGYASAADWMARAAGTSMGEAQAALDAANALDGCPETKKALLDGELSLGQAAEITRTEAEVPGSESELADIAKKHGMGKLRDKARKRRLEAKDPDDLHARQHSAREFSWSIDKFGMFRMSGALAPEVGIPIGHRLDKEADRVRREARADGRNERHEAYNADAFARMMNGACSCATTDPPVVDGRARTDAASQPPAPAARKPARSGSADVTFVCDIRAWWRGFAEQGEVCHIIGGGPVPVSVVKETAQYAFLKMVFHDGVRIHTVKHMGRYRNAELRTALELGLPPDFDGIECADGCDRHYGLQWDHVDPVANDGPTSYDNLKPRCRIEHVAKTERDRDAGLLKGKRRRRRAPDGDDGRGPP